jgi:hypothetical protein
MHVASMHMHGQAHSVCAGNQHRGIIEQGGEAVQHDRTLPGSVQAAAAGSRHQGRHHSPPPGELKSHLQTWCLFRKPKRYRLGEGLPVQ